TRGGSQIGEFSAPAQGVSGLFLVLTLDQSIQSAGGTASVSFEVVSSDTLPIPVDGSARVLARTLPTPEASLYPTIENSAVLILEVPASGRYIGLLQNVTGEPLTSGKVRCFLTLDPSR